MEIKDEMSSIRDEQSSVAVETFLLQSVELGKERWNVNYYSWSDETCTARVDQSWKNDGGGAREAGEEIEEETGRNREGSESLLDRPHRNLNTPKNWLSFTNQTQILRTQRIASRIFFQSIEPRVEPASKHSLICASPRLNFNLGPAIYIRKSKNLPEGNRWKSNLVLTFSGPIGTTKVWPALFPPAHLAHTSMSALMMSESFPNHSWRFKLRLRAQQKVEREVRWVCVSW